MLLAYIPFVDPVSASGLFDTNAYWWVLLVPLALGVAMAYKAVRVLDVRRYWTQVLSFTLQILVGVAALGLAAVVVLNWVLPMITPMPTP